MTGGGKAELGSRSVNDIIRLMQSHHELLKKIELCTKKFYGSFGQAFLILANAVISAKVRRVIQSNVEIEIRLVSVKVIGTQLVFAWALLDQSPVMTFPIVNSEWECLHCALNAVNTFRVKYSAKYNLCLGHLMFKPNCRL